MFPHQGFTHQLLGYQLTGIIQSLSMRVHSTAIKARHSLLTTLFVVIIKFLDASENISVQLYWVYSMCVCCQGVM